MFVMFRSLVVWQGNSIGRFDPINRLWDEYGG